MGISNDSPSENNFAYGAIATIDLDKIQQNYKTLVTAMAPAKCSAVIKADAYGLGAAYVGPVLYQAGCRIFFVAQLIEALRLQPHLPQDAQIAILNGVQQGAEEETAKAGLIPVLNSFDAITSWKHLCQKQQKKLPAIIQIDTGMSRLGLDEDELQQLIQSPEIFEIADICYIMSHLASGDEALNPSNQMQITTLKSAIVQLPKCKIAFANSGGIFLGDDFKFDLARPGIALYGVDPHGQSPSTIQPVLTLQARVIQTRHVKKGVAVGYGGSHITTRDGAITTIAVGYADGWHRALGNKGAVYFEGQRIPIIGRVSMDSITIDTTDLKGATLKRSDLVELIGAHQSLEDVARDAGTIAYEILTSLGHRYQRIYVQNSIEVKS